MVRRSDGSGTTCIFTNYLAKVSPEWKEKVGVVHRGSGRWAWAARATRVSPPMCAVNGSIGYVEYAYALKNKLAHVSCGTATAEVWSPTSAPSKPRPPMRSGKAARLRRHPHRPAGQESWPITGVTYILLLYKQQDKPQNAAETMRFFDWAFKNGQAMAAELDYVPLPEPLVRQIADAWKSQVKHGSGRKCHQRLLACSAQVASGRAGRIAAGRPGRG